MLGAAFTHGATGPALAQATAAAERFDLVAPLSVAGRYLGDVKVRVDTSGAGEIDADRVIELVTPLVSAEVAASLKQQVRGGFAAFDAFAPTGISVAYDPSALSIEVKLPAAARGLSTVRIAGREPPDPSRYATPAEVAAGVQLFGQETLRYDGGAFGDTAGVRADGFVTIGGFDGVTLSGAGDFRADATDRFQPDGWTVTRDWFRSAIRAQVGDVFPLSSSFQSTERLQAIGISRRYQDIRPFQNIRPTGRQGIVLERDSSVDVFVNGLQVQTLQLPTGRYDLDDFPLTEGANAVRLVVRDASGREEIIDRSVLYSPILLAPGLSDFGLWAGRRRGADGGSNGPPVATGYYLLGIGRSTLGFNGQAGRAGGQLGATAAIASGRNYLAFGLSSGVATRLGRHGLAVSADAQAIASIRSEEDLRVSVRFDARQRHFFDPIAEAFSNPDRWRLDASATFELNRLTAFSLSAFASRGRLGTPDSETVSGGVVRRFGRLTLSTFGSYVRREGREKEASFALGLTMPIGQTGQAIARHDSRNDRTELEASRFRRGQGRDWTARAVLGRRGGEQDVTVQAAYYGHRVFAAVDHVALFPFGLDGPRRQQSIVRGSTFIGYADGVVGWGREGLDGFTISRRHPSLKGVDYRIEQAGQTLFRSDPFGPAVIAVPRPYTETRQEVIVDELPPGYTLPETVRTIFPSFASGYRLDVGTDAYLSASGVLVGKSGKPVGLIVGALQPVSGKAVEFFTTEDGRFFAEGLSAKTYSVVINDKKVGSLMVKPGAQALVEVGTVVVDAP